jgi:hypothetical protein
MLRLRLSWTRWLLRRARRRQRLLLALEEASQQLEFLRHPLVAVTVEPEPEPLLGREPLPDVLTAAPYPLPELTPPQTPEPEPEPRLAYDPFQEMEPALTPEEQTEDPRQEIARRLGLPQPLS